ncbi:type I-C CRISPR-associated protein Cas7/Csd2 [Treponema saccharophilum]|uniref:CRISPR-associated protein, Csd2 family n=1 Tax=Treponema saccharophilum DSM 2985 TaxID=907348 RepID=H7EJ29_9SPIR|nr:type I-C CRISPR-associated protein Cas7/Csd2 [Treponema saccharophilum]EIC02343.1 CRISPR-associated protein, Csd2 family [Treponema saccharophilum DSM 2985]BDC97703.1 type I-C CRISPR-associated protein Cas7/Csd2 [Treponema saccharophilum]
MAKLEKRYDFVLYFDVKDGNPNGDPDAGNLPRIDAETGNGIVTDVCLKRKIRNYVQISKGAEAGYDIFVKEKAVLNKEIDDIYKELGINADSKNKAKGADVEKGRAGMCKKFFDIRTFGAVLSTGANAGQVRGPVQLTFARSVEPVVALEHSITRMAVTSEEESEKQGGDNRTMGRKYTIPYGLYKAYGFVSPHFASSTGFSTEDLDVLWDALTQMFELDHSAARGLMTTRRLVIFEHQTALGTKPADELFNRVKCEHTGNVPARDFSDYTISLDGNPLSEIKTVVAL